MIYVPHSFAKNDCPTLLYFLTIHRSLDTRSGDKVSPRNSKPDSSLLVRLEKITLTQVEQLKFLRLWIDNLSWENHKY